MDAEELRYRLQEHGWAETRHGHFDRVIGNREVRVRFTGPLIEVCIRSQFKQWVIVAREAARHAQVTRRGKIHINNTEVRI